MIGQSNQDEQIESRDNILCIGTYSDIASNPTLIYYPQAYVHTLEENIVSKVQSGEDNVMTPVGTRVEDAILTAIENVVTASVELAVMSANAPSEPSNDGNVLEPNQGDFLGNTEGLRVTASSRINSRTDINRIDKTRGKISVEEGDLLVNEKNFDRRTYVLITSTYTY